MSSRAGDARGELARHPRVSTPVAAHRIAVAIVPFAPAGGKRAEAMAAGADVPGLRHELEAPQHGILRDRLQQRRRGIEAVVAAGEGGGEVEAEAVHAGGPRVVAQRVHGEAQHRRAVERQRVAASRIVGVMRVVAGQGAVVGGVVQAAQAQRRPQFVAFARVVEHDVQQHFDAGFVQRGDTGREFGHAARSQPRVRRHERDRVVAPVVGEAQGSEVALVHPGGDRHQLDGGDAEAHQVRDGRRVREAGAGAAHRLGHLRVRLRVAAHVQLVDDGVGPRRAAAPGWVPLPMRERRWPWGRRGRCRARCASSRRAPRRTATHAARTGGRAPWRTGRPAACAD